MQIEPTLQDVLSAVQGLSTHMDERFSGVEDRLSNVEFEVKDIRSQMVTKDQLDAKLTELKTDLSMEIDRFVVLHQTLDVEIISLRSRCERMETFMRQVGKKLDIEYVG